MTKIIQILLLILLSFPTLAAEDSLQTDEYQLANTCMSECEAMTIDRKLTPIKIVRNEQNGKPKLITDTGAGLMRIFETDTEKFVILGKNFRNQWKLSVGGKVEPKDATLFDAFKRELDEEWFGQLQLTESTSFLNDGKPQIAGGMTIQGTTVKTTGWGPYFTFYATEKGYDLPAIEKAVAIMSSNANRYFMLADLFHKDYESREVTQNQKLATDILMMFYQARLGKTEGFKDMDETVKTAVEAIATTGTYNSPPNQTALDFARQQSIRTYSEYSEFKLINWEDYCQEVAKDKTKDKSKREYFPHEDNAQEMFLLTKTQN